MIRTIAFWSAVMGYALLAIMIVAGGAATPGYSHVADFISELGATGAPRAWLVNWLGFLPIGLCIITFAVAGALVAPRGGLRYAGFFCLVLFALGYIGAAFYPCDVGCRSTAPSVSQTMHNLSGLGGYLGAPVGLILLGVSSRRWPGAGFLFPLGLVCGVVSLLAFFVMLAETPVGGLVQRVLEGAVAVWILACAFSLRREPTTT